MQKRAFERIPAELQANFFCGNTMYSGTVTNLSENGMFIKTRMCFPFNSKFEILIPLKEEVLKVPTKVSRIEKTEEFYDGMGVEVLGPCQNYLEFVNRLKSPL
jgi:Tfp pilus assembly protein PilZ